MANGPRRAGTINFHYFLYSLLPPSSLKSTSSFLVFLLGSFFFVIVSFLFFPLYFLSLSLLSFVSCLFLFLSHSLCSPPNPSPSLLIICSVSLYLSLPLYLPSLASFSLKFSNRGSLIIISHLF